MLKNISVLLLISSMGFFAYGEGNGVLLLERSNPVANSDTWYRIVSSDSTSHHQKCIELNQNEVDGKLYIQTVDEQNEAPLAFDGQLWSLRPLSKNSNLFALVCKAAPGGYLSIVPVSEGNPIDNLDAGQMARWEYIPEAAGGEEDKYGFLFIMNADENHTSSMSVSPDYNITTLYLIEIANSDVSEPIYMNDAGNGIVNIDSSGSVHKSAMWRLEPVNH